MYFYFRQCSVIQYPISYYDMKRANYLMFVKFTQFYSSDTI